MKDFKCRMAMLIDDNPIDNLIHRKVIENAGYAENIVVMESAVQALQYFEKIISEGHSMDALPDVIFLDISMPQMNGFEFLKSFAGLNESLLKNCRVIMLSSSSNFDDLVSANGSNYISRFISKPLNKEALLSIEA
jgi:CheY-like chemotaxis protein